MTAPHEPQHPVVERLNPHAEAVDTRPTQGRQILHIQIVGICLDGHLLQLRTVEKFTAAFQNPSEPLRPAQRRCPAPEIYRPDRFGTDELPPQQQFALHCLQHLTDMSEVGAPVEVAIAANGAAERYMEIQARHNVRQI